MTGSRAAREKAAAEEEAVPAATAAATAAATPPAGAPRTPANQSLAGSGSSWDIIPRGSRSSDRRCRTSPSSQRRGCRQERSQPIVQRVIKEVGGAGTYPVLTKTNYNEWSMLMRVKLQARGLWDAIRYGDVDYQEDWLALDTLLSVVPLVMMLAMITSWR